MTSILEDAIASYELQMPEICGIQPLAACFLLRFHLKNWAPPAKNSSATAIITIKPERLAHHCVDQDLLYPWMCYTASLNFTEAKTSIFLHLQYDFTWGNLFAVSDSQGRVPYDNSCFVVLSSEGGVQT